MHSLRILVFGEEAMFTTFRIIVVWFYVISLILQSGCAHKPKPYLPEEVRAQLGTVGIVSARFRPDADLSVPAKGWLAGAGRKSARWAGKGASSVLVGGAQGCGGDSSGICAALVIAFTVTTGVVGGLAGGVAGAIQAEPSRDVSFAEEVIMTVIDSMNIPENLRDRAATVAQSQTSNNIVVVPNQGPASSEEKLLHTSLTEQGIDTILEISVSRLALVGDWDLNPPLEFQMNSRIRLVRTSDGNELYESSVDYLGGTRLFSEWADNNAQAFIETLDMAYQSLAEKIVGEVFLLFPLAEPEESNDNKTPAGEYDNLG